MTEICRPVSVLSDTNKRIGKNDTQTQTVRVFVARPEAIFVNIGFRLERMLHPAVPWSIGTYW